MALRALCREAHVVKSQHIELLEAFEEASDLRLPAEYKVYLMEIGSEGDIYFMSEWVPGIDDPNAASINSKKKSIPIK